MCYGWLAVVLNSVWKVGNACFKLLIVDEAGLVRRHFVSRTLLRGTDAMDAYNSVRGLVNNADNVISSRRIWSVVMWPFTRPCGVLTWRTSGM